MVTIFTRCTEDAFFVGESNEKGEVVALMKYPDLRQALHHFNHVVRHYKDFAEVVFDDLDRLLKPHFKGV